MKTWSAISPIFAGEFEILIIRRCTSGRRDLHRWLIFFCHAGHVCFSNVMRLASVKWMEVDWALKKEGGTYTCCCRGRRTERAVRSRNSDYLAEQD